MVMMRLKMTIFGGLMMAIQMASAAPGSLEGQWGGDRLQMVIDANGGRLESDCASGSFTGPVVLAKDGRFIASGTFTQHQTGPDLADADAALTKAHYAGEVMPDGLTMTLSIQAVGKNAAQVFTLRKGAKVKLVRCL